MQLQAHLVRVFQRELFPDDLGATFGRRLASWFPESAWVLDFVEWEEVQSLVHKMRGPLANGVWKTRSGSWITSR
eukprot:1606347-Pyramimonas_sp.AAC.1